MGVSWFKQIGWRRIVAPLLILPPVFLVSGFFISRQVDEAIQTFQDAYLSLNARLLNEKFDQFADGHRNRLKVLAIRPEVQEGLFVIRAEGNVAPLRKLLQQEMEAGSADHVRVLNAKKETLVTEGTLGFDPLPLLSGPVEAILGHAPITDPQKQLGEVVHSRLVHVDGRFFLLTVAPLLDVEDISGVIIQAYAVHKGVLSALRDELHGRYDSHFEISLAAGEQVVHSTFADPGALALPGGAKAFDRIVAGRLFRHIPLALRDGPFALLLSSDNSDVGGLHDAIRMILTMVFVVVSGLLLIIILFNLRQIVLRQQARDLAERETRFRRLADAALEGIAFSRQGRIIDVNQALTVLFGCEAGDLIGREVAGLIHASQRADFHRLTGNEASERICLRMDGATFVSEIRSRLLDETDPDQVVVTAIRDISARKEIEEHLRQAKEQAERAFQELQLIHEEKSALNVQLNQSLVDVREANQRIMESIRYAERIQRTLLPRPGVLKEHLPESFFHWQPRDVVSGDLLYVHQSEWGVVVVLMDCTGHGVPGALMTMIAHGSLHRIIVNEQCQEDPAEILRRLNTHIKRHIHLEEDDLFTDCGLDCGVCCIYPEENAVIFSGAHIDLFLVTGDGPRVVAGNRYSIGYRRSDEGYSFLNQRIESHTPMTFYMCSDGLLDQLGGAHRNPFGKKRLQTLLDRLRSTPVTGHGEVIVRSVDDYRGDCEWKDDVTLVGFGLAPRP
ncbi:MAG: SpoIIE family protein phosphatase [Magnetococcales bacterium]|nr:SpoIIE family protein phosphatase [Magnetococcales bacterium]